MTVPRPAAVMGGLLSWFSVGRQWVLGDIFEPTTQPAVEHPSLSLLFIV